MSGPVTIRVANAERLALLTLADVLAPPPAIDLEQYAADEVTFPPGEAFPGPYDPERWPMWTEVLRAMSPDHPCRHVTIKKSAQIGGTILGLIFAYAMLHYGQNPGGVVHPTDGNGDAWSKGKFDRYLPPALRAALAVEGKEGGNSVRYKERRDRRATVEVAGANSPAALSQRTWYWAFLDDLSKWENNTAGDPETQAESRLQAVEFAKIVKTSTPRRKGDCRISAAFSAGSEESYHVPCPHCRHLQPLTWEAMQPSIEAGDLDRVGFSCVACGADIEEKHRRWMIDPVNGARWVAKHPERMRAHRSFHIWSAYCGLTSWRRIGEAWLAAKGSANKEEAFFNDTVGLEYDGDSEAPQAAKLIERARASTYGRGTVPAYMPLLFAGVDVQQDRIEWQVVAYGSEWRRAVVQYGVIPLPITEAEAQKRLSDLLGSKWRTENGAVLTIDQLAIDANYDTANVFSWVRRHPASKVIAVRGVAGWKPSILQKVGERTDTSGKARRYGGRFYNVAVDLLKLYAYRSFKVDDPGKPYAVAFPHGLDDAFFDGLTCARRIERRASGKRVQVWETPHGQRDEPLDTWNYAEAAARKWGYAALTDASFERLCAERLRPVAAGQLDLEMDLAPPVAAAPAPTGVAVAGDAAAKPQPAPARRKTRSDGWVNVSKGWMSR